MNPRRRTDVLGSLAENFRSMSDFVNHQKLFALAPLTP